MKIADILAMTGANKASIYRWMDKHPKVDLPDAGSLIGHPFPKPIRKEGREVIWDEEAVRAWWEANAKVVGRHSEEKAVTTMPWESFRKAMLQEPERDFDESTGEERIIDDITMIQRYEKEGNEVRLWFRNVSDAVYFKLKHY